MLATAEADVREDTDEPFEPELLDTPQEVTRIEYPVAMSVIADLQQRYSGLTIAGINDKAGFKAVDEARREVKRLKVQVENRRKQLKADALEYGRNVDAAAKRLSEPLEALEKALDSKQKAITDEVERLKREAEEKAKSEKAAKLKGRMDALQAVKAYVSPAEVEAMGDAAFSSLLGIKRQEFEQAAAAEELRLKLNGRMKRLDEVGAFVPSAEVAGLSDEDFVALVGVKEQEKTQREAAAQKLKDDQAALEKQKKALAEKEAKDKAARREAILTAAGILMSEMLEAPCVMDVWTDQEFAEAVAQRKAELEVGSRRMAMITAAGLTLEHLSDDALNVGLTDDVTDEQFAETISQRRKQIDDAAALKAKEDADKAKTEADRAEQLKPDREKLLAFAETLGAMAARVPEVSPVAAFARGLIVQQINNAVREIRRIAETNVR